MFVNFQVSACSGGRSSNMRIQSGLLVETLELCGCFTTGRHMRITSLIAIMSHISDTDEGVWTEAGIRSNTITLRSHCR